MLHPRVAVPFCQMQEQPFDADRCAGGKERLNKVGPKSPKALEDQVGMLVGCGVERSMLKKLQDRTLYRRGRHAKLSVAVFAQPEVIRKETRPNVPHAAEPWQASKPTWEPFTGSAEEIDRIVRAQWDEVCATEDFQRRASAGMDRGGFLLKTMDCAQPGRRARLGRERPIAHAVKPAGATVVVGQPAGYAAALEPCRS